MKDLRHNMLRLLLVCSVLFIGISCSNDSTITKEITENTFLGRKTDKETGELVGVGNRFSIMKSGWVKARLDLSDYFENNDKDLMLHFDWIDPSGATFYKKQKIVTEDSTVVSSAISIAPALREAGAYKLRVFLFRQLVCEKEFELLPKFLLDTTVALNIDLFTRKSKKTGEILDKGTRFPIMKKGWVKSQINFNSLASADDRVLLFYMDWTDSNDKILYRKHFDILPKDSVKTLNASWSIAPETRQAGDYKVKLYLFDELLTQKEFKLLPPIDIKEIQSNISFCSKISKKTGKRSGFGTSFSLKEKAKVNACIDLKNCRAFGERELKFQLKWIGADGKSFYTKRFNFTPTTATKSLKSAITISPKKRVKGTYKLQVYLYNELLSEKSFRLQPSISYKKLQTKITFARKENKETGERIGEATNFLIKKKRKVRAFIDLKNSLVFGKKTLQFRIDWVDSKGKSFYSKKINITPDKNATTLKSAISIYPNKRKAGKYKIRLYLFDELIKEKAFTLKDDE